MKSIALRRKIIVSAVIAILIFSFWIYQTFSNNPIHTTEWIYFLGLAIIMGLFIHEAFSKLWCKNQNLATKIGVVALTVLIVSAIFIGSFLFFFYWSFRNSGMYYTYYGAGSDITYIFENGLAINNQSNLDDLAERAEGQGFFVESSTFSQGNSTLYFTINGTNFIRNNGDIVRCMIWITNNSLTSRLEYHRNDVISIHQKGNVNATANMEEDYESDVALLNSSIAAVRILIEETYGVLAQQSQTYWRLDAVICAD